MAVTTAQVDAIYSNGADVTPFLTTAQLVVSENLASSGLSDAMLDEITKYLAAHYLAMTDLEGSDRAGAIAVTYGKALGDFLKATVYGQTALALDSSGTLEEMGNTKFALDVVQFDL